MFDMSPVAKDMTFGPSDYNAGSSLIPRANRYSKVISTKYAIIFNVIFDDCLALSFNYHQ